MAEAARSTDLYSGMVASGAVATRAEAKVGHARRDVRRDPRRERAMMPQLTRRYPRAIGLVEEAALAGERGEVVHTLLGRVRRCRPGRGPSSRTSRASRRRPRSPRTGTATARPGAGSPATSSCRAAVRSGRCAGSPTSATGCGGWAPARSRAAAPRVLPARRGRRAHARGPGRRVSAAVRAPPPRPAGCCSAPSPSLPARRRGRRVLGRTPAERSPARRREPVGTAALAARCPGMSGSDPRRRRCRPRRERRWRAGSMRGTDTPSAWSAGMRTQVQALESETARPRQQRASAVVDITDRAAATRRCRATVRGFGSHRRPALQPERLPREGPARADRRRAARPTWRSASVRLLTAVQRRARCLVAGVPGDGDRQHGGRQAVAPGGLAGCAEGGVRNLVRSLDAAGAPDGIRAVSVTVRGTLAAEGPFTPDRVADALDAAAHQAEAEWRTGIPYEGSTGPPVNRRNSAHGYGVVAKACTGSRSPRSPASSPIGPTMDFDDAVDAGRRPARRRGGPAGGGRPKDEGEAAEDRAEAEIETPGGRAGRPARTTRASTVFSDVVTGGRVRGRRRPSPELHVSLGLVHHRARRSCACCGGAHPLARRGPSTSGRWSGGSRRRLETAAA